MITVNLLHPIKPVPVQSWTFDSQIVIRIGRSKHNDVTLLSAVVSRYHAEIRYNGANWEIINLGTNGTYIGNRLIDSTTVSDSTVIRLSNAGPKLQIQIDSPGAETGLETKKQSQLVKTKKDRSRETLVSQLRFWKQRRDSDANPSE